MSDDHPIQIAGNLSADHPEVAQLIRDLYALARAQEQLLVAYRTQRRPAEEVLDRINKHKHSARP